MRATPGDVAAALWLGGHMPGDYWVQTGYQAATKGQEGREGQAACLRHVATMTAAKAAALGALHLSGRKVSWRRAAAALALEAGTHYFADRRRPLRALAERAGSGDFWRMGQPRPGHDDNVTMGTGAALLDQSWHAASAYLAALIAAGGAE